MTGNTYIDHMKRRLDTIEREIAKARRNFEKASVDGQMAALQELSALKTRQEELSARLTEAMNAHADQWSTLHSSFQEDVDAIFEWFERWAVKNT